MVHNTRKKRHLLRNKKERNEAKEDTYTIYLSACGCRGRMHIEEQRLNEGPLTELKQKYEKKQTPEKGKIWYRQTKQNRQEDTISRYLQLINYGE